MDPFFVGLLAGFALLNKAHRLSSGLGEVHYVG